MRAENKCKRCGLKLISEFEIQRALDHYRANPGETIPEGLSLAACGYCSDDCERLKKSHDAANALVLLGRVD